MKNDMTRVPGRVAAASAVAFLLAGTAGGVAAAEPGIYLAVDLGTSTVDVKSSDLRAAGDALLDDAGLTPVDFDTRTDRNAISPSVTWGYRFSPRLAAEITVLNLGKVTWNGDGTASNGTTTTAGDAGLRIKSTGPAVSALGSWPVNERLSIDGRAGGFFFWTKVQQAHAFGLNRTTVSDNQHDTGLFAGVGATLGITQFLAVRAGYTFFKDALDGEDVSRIAAGFTYSIGK